MTNLLTRIMVLVFVALLTVKCDSNKARVFGTSDLSQIDTFIKELPTGIDGKTSQFYYLTRNVVKLADFSNLENGFDSLMIRIWLNSLQNDTSHVVEIEKSSGQWQARIFTLIEIGNPNNKLTPHFNKSYTLVKPKSGWSAFSKNLFNYSILKLPGFENIPGYDLSTGGVATHVEISTPSTYRFYTYVDLLLNVKNIQEARKLNAAITLIREEFGLL